MNDQNKDYKYVIQDFSKVYIGGKCNISDVLEADDTPEKVRMAMMRILDKEQDEKQEFDQILKEGDSKNLVYKFFLQGNVKLIVLQEEESKKGKSVRFVQKTYELDEFVRDIQTREDSDKIIISEIIIKKLNLLKISV